MQYQEVVHRDFWGELAAVLGLGWPGRAGWPWLGQVGDKDRDRVTVFHLLY